VRNAARAPGTVELIAPGSRGGVEICAAEVALLHLSGKRPPHEVERQICLPVRGGRRALALDHATGEVVQLDLVPQLQELEEHRQRGSPDVELLPSGNQRRKWKRRTVWEIADARPGKGGGRRVGTARGPIDRGPGSTGRKTNGYS